MKPDNCDTEFQTPNHLRVGVSWSHALASCRWMPEQFKWDATLPREVERERSTQQTDRPEPPWGRRRGVRAAVQHEREGGWTHPFGGGVFE